MASISLQGLPHDMCCVMAATLGTAQLMHYGGLTAAYSTHLTGSGALSELLPCSPLLAGDSQAHCLHLRCVVPVAPKIVCFFFFFDHTQSSTCKFGQSCCGTFIIIIITINIVYHAANWSPWSIAPILPFPPLAIPGITKELLRSTLQVAEGLCLSLVTWASLPQPQSRTMKTL